MQCLVLAKGSCACCHPGCSRGRGGLRHDSELLPCGEACDKENKTQTNSSGHCTVPLKEGRLRAGLSVGTAGEGELAARTMPVTQVAGDVSCSGRRTSWEMFNRQGAFYREWSPTFCSLPPASRARMGSEPADSCYESRTSVATGLCFPLDLLKQPLRQAVESVFRVSPQNSEPGSGHTNTERLGPALREHVVLLSRRLR